MLVGGFDRFRLHVFVFVIFWSFLVDIGHATYVKKVRCFLHKRSAMHSGDPCAFLGNREGQRKRDGSGECEMRVGRLGKIKGLEEEIQFPMITFVTMQLGSYN